MLRTANPRRKSRGRFGRLNKVMSLTRDLRERLRTLDRRGDSVACGTENPSRSAFGGWSSTTRILLFASRADYTTALGYMLTVSANCLTSIGFRISPSKPMASNRPRSSFTTEAVNATTGMSLISGRVRSS